MSYEDPGNSNISKVTSSETGMNYQQTLTNGDIVHADSIGRDICLLFDENQSTDWGSSWHGSHNSNVGIYEFT